MGTDLYRKYVLGDETEHSPLQRKVWAGTPWIVDLYTGGSADPERDRAIILWCAERFGEEAWPFSETPRAGRWKRGGATVFGWTWYGFDTEEAMNECIAAWPNPPVEVMAAQQAGRFPPGSPDVHEEKG